MTHVILLMVYFHFLFIIPSLVIPINSSSYNLLEDNRQQILLNSSLQVVSKEVGSSITFMCRVPDETETFISWIKPSKNIFIGIAKVNKNFTRYSANLTKDVQVDGLIYQMSIRDIQVDDDSSYTCDIGNSNDVLTVQLNVLVPPGSATITSNRTNDLTEGDVIFLICSSTGGNPNPILKWRHGDSIISVEKTRSIFPEAKFGRTVGMLEWMLSWNDHLNDFTCFDEREIISASKAFPVKFAPRIDMGPYDPLIVLQHSNLTLNCTVTSFPDVIGITWYKDGDFIGTGSQHQIMNVTSSHQGRYVCSARNYVERSGSLQLVVHSRPKMKLILTQINETSTQPPPSSSPPALTSYVSQNGDITAKLIENYSIDVDCSCEGNPKVSIIKWMKDGVIAQKGSVLNLYNVQARDAGIYVCTCSNLLTPYNENSFQAFDLKKFTVSVLYKPGKASMTLPSSIISGKQVTLYCSSAQTGNPPCEYVWWKDNVEIQRGDHLDLNPVVLSHTGLYSCVPRNDVGDGEKDSKQLTVQEYAQSLNQPDVIESEEEPNSIVQLKCSFRGIPPPTITWFKNDVNIINVEDSSDLYVVETFNQTMDVYSYRVTSILSLKGSKRNLSEKQLKPDDAGNYTCRASNDVYPRQYAQSSVTLAIKFCPIVDRNSNQRLELHAQGVIVFNIRSYPQPTVKWYNSSMEMTEGNPSNIDAGHDNTNVPSQRWWIRTTPVTGQQDLYVTVLEISDVNEFDLTTYSIDASNDCGSIKSSVQVTAATAPEAPMNLLNASVTWGSVELKWTAGSSGGINQQFLIEAVSLKDGTKKQIAVSNRTSFIFAGLQPNITYKFLMFAENRIGKSNSSNEILVTLPAIKVNSPSRVDFTTDDRSILISLPPHLYSTTANNNNNNANTLSKSGPTDLWGDFCARVDVYDGVSWSTEYPCVREMKVKLGEDKLVKISQVRVSICSEERPDVCSEEKYGTTLGSTTETLSSELTIVVGCVCGGVVAILLIILLILCVRKKKQPDVNVNGMKTITHTIHLEDNNNMDFTRSCNNNINLTGSYNNDLNYPWPNVNGHNSLKNSNIKINNLSDVHPEWNNTPPLMTSLHNYNNNLNNNFNNNFNNNNNYNFSNSNMGSTFIGSTEPQLQPSSQQSTALVNGHCPHHHPLHHHHHQIINHCNSQSPYISEDEHNSTMELIQKPAVNYLTDGSNGMYGNGGTFKNFSNYNENSLTDINKPKKIIHEVIV